jgi:hypothetical protein
VCLTLGKGEKPSFNTELLKSVKKTPGKADTLGSVRSPEEQEEWKLNL